MFRGEEDNQQRLQNVVQLKECCEKLVSQYDVPVIIGGDFNNGKNAEQGDMPYQTMLKEGFCDIRLTAKETTELLTHHEYPFLNEEGIYEKGSFPERILDYIFTYSKSVIIPEKFDVLISQNALDSSDHCPLIGIFSL